MKTFQIAHISDIHIGARADRSDEYREAFDNIAAGLSACANLRAVVITGDVFDHNTRYSSAQDIADFYYLVDKLSHCAPVVIIPGNHDFNNYNLHERDLISPLTGICADDDGVIPAVPGPARASVKYLHRSGWYTIAGVQFYHLFLRDAITHTEFEEFTRAHAARCRRAVLLHHSPVEGVTFGGVQPEYKCSKQAMRGWAAVMLGDIHSTSFMLENAAYAGSALQQKVTESSVRNYIVWEFTENTQLAGHTICPIATQYKSAVIKLLDFADVQALEAHLKQYEGKLMRQVKLISQPDTPPLYKERVYAMLKIIGDVSEVVIRPITDQVTDNERQAAISKNLSEALAHEMQAANLTEAESAEFLCIYGAAREIVHKIWYIKAVRWNNMFKYGPDNCIIFTKPGLGDKSGPTGVKSNIIGVVAPNAAGKTSIFDIIAMALFNKKLRSDSKDTAINNFADTAYVRVDFVVNDTHYYIERRDPRGGTVKCVLYKQKADISADVLNNVLALNSTQFDIATRATATETYKEITNLIGTIDQFRLTAMAYETISEFLSRGDKFLLEKFAMLFGLQDDALARAEDLKKCVEKRANDIVKPAGFTSYDQLPALRAKLQNEYNTYEQLLIQCAAERERLTARVADAVQNIILVAAGEKIPVDSTARLQEKIAAYTRELAVIKLDLQEIESKLTAGGTPAPCARTTAPAATHLLTEQYTSADKKRYKSAIKDLAARADTMAELNSTLQNLRMALAAMTEPAVNALPADVETRAAMLERELGATKIINELKFQYASGCTNCKVNASVHDKLTKLPQRSVVDIARERETIAKQRQDARAAEIAHNAYKKEKVFIEAAISSCINKLADAQKAHDELARARPQYARVCEVLNARELHDQYERGELYYNYQRKIELNAKQQALTADLARAERRLAVLNNTANARDLDKAAAIYEDLMQEKAKICEEIGRLDSKKLTILRELCTLDACERAHAQCAAEILKYNKFISILDNTGLKYAIVKNNIPRVVNLANEILQLTSSKIQLVYDFPKDSGLRFSIQETTGAPGSANGARITVPMRLGSGFQQFISAIALRLSLTYHLPMSAQFIMIDEGFGCMDSENIMQTAHLFTNVAQLYKFIFVISHREEIQRIINPITIESHATPRGQVSYINSDNAPPIVSPLLDNTLPQPQRAPVRAVHQFANDRPDRVENGKSYCNACGISVLIWSKHASTVKHATKRAAQLNNAQ